MRLFLCEKPSQGKDIGRILGATQRGEGCLSGSGVTITWCIGHLVEAAAPEVYDAALCAELEALFDAVRDTAQPVSPQMLRQRPLGVRLRDGVARLFTPVL